MSGVGARVASPGSRSTPRIEPSSSSAARSRRGSPRATSAAPPGRPAPVACQQVGGHPGLNVDRRHRVGDRVVEVLGEPQPLGRPHLVLLVGSAARVRRPPARRAGERLTGEYGGERPADHHEVVGAEVVVPDEVAADGHHRHDGTADPAPRGAVRNTRAPAATVGRPTSPGPVGSPRPRYTANTTAATPVTTMLHRRQNASDPIARTTRR